MQTGESDLQRGLTAVTREDPETLADEHNGPRLNPTSGG
jgi:hypothetical protein